MFLVPLLVLGCGEQHRLRNFQKDLEGVWEFTQYSKIQPLKDPIFLTQDLGKISFFACDKQITECIGFIDIPAYFPVEVEYRLISRKKGNREIKLSYDLGSNFQTPEDRIFNWSGTYDLDISGPQLTMIFGDTSATSLFFIEIVARRLE